MSQKVEKPMSPEMEEQLRRIRQEVIAEIERGRLFGLDLKIRQIQRNITLMTRV